MDDAYVGNPEIHDLPLSLPSCREEVDAFLARHGLGRDALDYCAGVYIDGRMVAVGGFAGHVIKCVAAEEDARGLGLMSLLMSHLRRLLREAGAGNIFVFTKPENLEIFQGLAFSLVGAAPRAILLESDRRGISRFVQGLADRLPAGADAGGPLGAVVMNCNPFTLGHQYLAETAAAQCGHLLVLVVEADRSAFPFEVRLDLCRKGCAHLSNVTVAPGGPYIISQATFPSYFIKEMSDVVATHAALDIDIFATRIAPALGLSARFVGQEPLDPVTAAYNAEMARRLPAAGVALHVVPRRESGGAPISASRVRALIREGRAAETAGLVPPSTYAYIVQHQEALAL